jgi:peptide/nickel transport system ATP-binding protein
MNEQTPVLECRDLSISYYVRAGEIPAVVDFNLKIMPGESIGLVGESGCGKSTVALAIMQYMGSNGGISGGQVLFHGKDMTTMSDEELREIRGSRISMIYQEPMASLNPAMKIGEQLCEVPIFHESISIEEARERSIKLIEQVKLPEPERIMDSYPHQLSGGQQQRVVIAMALLSKPELLILDEPTTALDVTVEAGIVDLVKTLAKEMGTSMIFISHNLGLILETCDRITVMYSGQAVERGTVNEVFNEMWHPYTRGLFNSIPLPGADKNSRPLIPIRGQIPLPHLRPKGCYFGPRCDFFREGVCDQALVKMRYAPDSTSQEARCERLGDINWDEQIVEDFSGDPAPIGDVVLELKDLKKYYEIRDNSLKALVTGKSKSYVKANESMSFTAKEAETVALVGESGCGKSTLAKVLMGLETATSGEVLLNGESIGSVDIHSRNASLVSLLQMVFQNPFDTLNPSHTVGSQISRVIRKFEPGISEEDANNRVLELLDLVKLPRDFANRRPRQLSGGQKQRVGIARAFAGNPKVVVADEPTSALDVSVQAAVTGLLMDIQREYKTTLVFISHDLSIVRYLADRIVVMYLGNIVEQGTTDEIFAPPYHPYTEALLSAVPIADTRVKKRRIVLEGELPSAVNPPSGCPFQTRCPRKLGSICETEEPPIIEVSNGHQIACHIAQEELEKVEPVLDLTDYSEAVA